MRSPEQLGADDDRDETVEANLTNEDLDSESEDDVEDDSDLNLLIALAELDAEAAEAYRIAAENTDQVHLRAKLEEFRADHLRHVETFNQLISDAGGPEVSIELD
jgi:rubrerythrin